MFELIQWITICVYFVAACLLMLYGINSYVMIYLYNKGAVGAENKRNEILDSFDYAKHQSSLPYVTTQIPVYNEYNVAERVIRAACSMEYPKEKHEIQLLDDSDDETSALIDDIVYELQSKGHKISVVRRVLRHGFKAGALAEGLENAEGDFLAIFDADFIPPGDYLTKSIPFFLADESLGLVQARWGHLNRRTSLLTRAQSIGIDGHFMVEQAARNWGGLYMNFNGTAGIWRKKAIYDGGGWQWDTLTEDMDLSYRVQFAGWQTLYLPDLVVPAEIPEDIIAFKNQQFRWAKGSIETALKLFPEIFNAPISLFKKIEAFFHLTHYVVHPLMLILATLALPVMKAIDTGPGPVLFSIVAVILIFSMSAPSTLYIISQKAAYKNWLVRIVWLPFLIITGTGIAVSNSKAVLEAIAGKKSSFIRTPKKGDIAQKQYKTPVSTPAIIEVALGFYCVYSLSVYMAEGKYLIGPFLAIYAMGFLFTGLLTIAHSAGVSK